MPSPTVARPRKDCTPWRQREEDQQRDREGDALGLQGVAGLDRHADDVPGQVGRYPGQQRVAARPGVAQPKIQSHPHQREQHQDVQQRDARERRKDLLRADVDEKEERQDGRCGEHFKRNVS